MSFICPLFYKGFHAASISLIRSLANTSRTGKFSSIHVTFRKRCLLRRSWAPSFVLLMFRFHRWRAEGVERLPARIPFRSSLRWIGSSRKRNFLRQRILNENNDLHFRRIWIRVTWKLLYSIPMSEFNVYSVPKKKHSFWRWDSEG